MDLYIKSIERLKKPFKKGIFRTSRLLPIGLVALIISMIILSLMPQTAVYAGQEYVSISMAGTRPQLATGINTIEQRPWGYEYHLGNGDIVQVGDSTTTDFKANVKTIRGIQQDVWFSLGWTGGTFTPTLTGLTVSFDFNASTSVSIYPVDPSDRLPEGGIEYDIILKKRPTQNTITLNIDWQGMTWQKILALDVEYPDEASCEAAFGIEAAPYTRTSTAIMGADNVTYRSRAPYEVNSYLGTAMSRHDDVQVFGTNPANGIPITYTNPSKTYLYIHRGQMTDALGNKAWVEDINMDQAGKTITFTLPREWLRTATYPVSQVCGVDPAYTQKMGSFQSTALASDGVWDEYDLTALAGDGVVAEIILSNATIGTENTLGVSARASDHTPTTSDRYFTLHEAEGGGQTHCRTFVKTDANGLICAYHSDVSDADYFYVVGYWSNVTFTEMGWGSHFISSGNGWKTNHLGITDTVVHWIIANNEADAANYGGVRTKGSALSRYVLIHEPEAGGYSFIDMMVQTSSANLGEYEIYTDDYLNVDFWIDGYFDTALNFVEKFDYISLTSSWVQKDVSSYLDENGRVCDFLLGSIAEASTVVTGVRDGDDAATERSLTEHEAEGVGGTGEFSGFSMTAKSNSSGLVYAKGTRFFMMGYFKPAGGVTISVSPTSYDFGVVAASSTPYTTTSYFTIDNTSTVQTDQTISVTTSSWAGGAGWTHSDTATAGADTAGLKANKGGTWGVSDIIVKNASPNYIYENCPPTTDYSFGLELLSPTSFTVSNYQQKSITVRVSAAAG